MAGHINRRNISLIASFAILTTIGHSTATWAQQVQGFGRMGRRGDMRSFNAGQAEITVINIPVAVLTKQLNLSVDQMARITEIQNGFQTTRQQMRDQMRATFPRPNAGNGTGSTSGGSGTQTFTRPSAATMQAIVTRMQANQQTLQTEEQARTKAIRAVLTQEQLSALRVVESDATTFAGVDIPIDTLAQFILSTDERNAITTVYQDARRQIKQAEQKAQAQNSTVPPGSRGFFGGRGGNSVAMSGFRSQMEQLRQDINQKALATLSPTNRTAVEAYVKAHPTPQFGRWRLGTGA